MKAQELQQLSSSLGDCRGATRGAIVVLGSAASYVATPGMGMYTASKHAIMGLVKSAGESGSPFQTLVSRQWC
jgi:short-subunit dehydrogenase